MNKKSGWKARKWTKKENDFLRDNYLKLDYHQIAKILGRVYGSINARRIKLSLPKKISGGNMREPICNKNVKKVECIYLAGLFDGEGSVTIKNKEGKLSSRWAIGMKEKELMEYLKKIWNCGINYQRTDGLVYWSVNTHKDLEILLPQVIPYMKIKKNKSEELLNVIRNHKRGDITRLK